MPRRGSRSQSWRRTPPRRRAPRKNRAFAARSFCRTRDAVRLVIGSARTPVAVRTQRSDPLPKAGRHYNCRSAAMRSSPRAFTRAPLFPADVLSSSPLATPPSACEGLPGSGVSSSAPDSPRHVLFPGRQATHPAAAAAERLAAKTRAPLNCPCLTGYLPAKCAAFAARAPDFFPFFIKIQ